MSRHLCLRLLLLVAFFTPQVSTRAQQSTQQKIKRDEREVAERMLENMHDVLKKNYYDPSFHGIDIDARYKEYLERLKKVETLGGAFRVVAAYLSGLNDSHTVFLPPNRNYIADYGFGMQMVGDGCYVTKVRPGSDAEQKIHPGDQILSLDGFAIGRTDLFELQYYLHQIAPKPLTGMSVRLPSGETRNVLIATKYVDHHPGTYLDFEMWSEKAEEEKYRYFRRQRYVERGDVLFWKMPTFVAEDNEIDQVLDVARRHKALVLDLRGNGGGSIDLMKRLVGSVMDHEVVVGTRVTRRGKKPEIAGSKPEKLFAGKLIVLIDSDSASASEVFARVMQLEHRAMIIGDRSSGSVMEAIRFPFQDYSGVIVLYGASITVADLLMGDGKSLEKVGVTPDMHVLPSAAQLARGEDPALAKAAELAGAAIGPVEAGKLFPFEWAPE